MMKRLDTTPRIFNPGEGEKVVAAMAIEDPEWTYEIDPDPKGSGRTRIRVIDEDGEFVAFMT